MLKFSKEMISFYKMKFLLDKVGNRAAFEYVLKDFVGKFSREVPSDISPSLTIVIQPGFDMDKNEFKGLHKEIKNKKNKVVNYKNVLETDLILRESTKNMLFLHKLFIAFTRLFEWSLINDFKNVSFV
jgi:hypothetical protein